MILLAVRWFLRYGLSCRGVAELLAERGTAVDHVIDVYVSKRRSVPAVTRFFEALLAGRERPLEVTRDLAACGR